MSAAPNARPEFSRPASLESFEAAPIRMTREATEAERAALSRRLGLVRLEAFSGEAVLRRTASGAELTAEWRADVVQSCVVSLEEVKSRLSDRFAIAFAPSQDEPPQTAVEIELNFETDAPDPLPDEAIDVGEYLTEQLALALDPYPRKPGAAPLTDAGRGGGDVSPFAELARFRGGEGDAE